MGQSPRVVGTTTEKGETVKHLTYLKLSEGVHLDQDRLEDLAVKLGPSGAEDVVCRAMEELAMRMTYAERCRVEMRYDEMNVAAQGIIALAEQVGMLKLANVARDVVNANAAEDRIALAAVAARLLRIGERSLSEIWDLQEFSL